jgi:hypothetical protein
MVVMAMNSLQWGKTGVGLLAVFFVAELLSVSHSGAFLWAACAYLVWSVVLASRQQRT